MNILNFILARASEPSTWRGLFLFASAVGVTVSPELQNAIIATGLGASGLVGVLTKG